MVTARFEQYIQNDSRNHGMFLRYVYPPHPVGFIPKERLRGYVDGNSPVTGKPLMQEVIDALTLPLTEGELNPVIEKKPRRPRLLEPDTEENLHRLFIENGWTDGNPIILPTEERVAEMLTGTDRDPQEVIGRMSVTTHQERLEYTVEKVAVNAVMAGCRPEPLPVLLAVAATEIPSLPSSTTSFSSMMMINGPIRNELGMNCGIAALSPFNYANSVLGRAWTLMSINFGDARPGETFMHSLGHPVNYNNLCHAENEEDSAFAPFHAEKGFKPEDSTVSLFRGWVYNGINLGNAKAMATALKNMSSFGKTCTFLMDPLVSVHLKEEGFKTKEELRLYLAQETGAFPQVINFIVVGGQTNPMWALTDYIHTKTVSIDEWIPKTGLKKDAKPLRMPQAVQCKDGTCSMPAQ
ncbi:MAG TPA: hypothetical protein GX699_02245 [Firmicutes bacterium]|nr:hypothetical protein [Bacillota bacterium]